MLRNRVTRPGGPLTPKLGGTGSEAEIVTAVDF